MRNGRMGGRQTIFFFGDCCKISSETRLPVIPKVTATLGRGAGHGRAWHGRAGCEAVACSCLPRAVITEVTGRAHTLRFDEHEQTRTTLNTNSFLYPCSLLDTCQTLVRHRHFKARLKRTGQSNNVRWPTGQSNDQPFSQLTDPKHHPSYKSQPADLSNKYAS